MAFFSSYRNQLPCTTSRETTVVFIQRRGFFKRTQLTFPKTYRRRDVRPWVNFISSRDTKINCGGYVSLISFSVFCFQIIAGNTLVFLNYLEQEKTTRMAFSPECITWVVVGLTESITIIALNSLTVIAFCRDRNFRKRSTYLVISLAVADMLSGGSSALNLFDEIGETWILWRHNGTYLRCSSSGFPFVR